MLEGVEIYEAVVVQAPAPLPPDVIFKLLCLFVYFAGPKWILCYTIVPDCTSEND